jgi:hypothetical protein
VRIFSPGQDDIQSQLDAILATQGGNDPDLNGHWSPYRYALLFEPGTHNNFDMTVGYYTSVYGLGRKPSDTIIDSIASWDSSANPTTGALDTFWRSAENFKVSNQWNTFTWATSQASPIRRIEVDGDLELSDKGYSSGGYMADMNVTGRINAGTQQQYFSRNSEM